MKKLLTLNQIIGLLFIFSSAFAQNSITAIGGFTQSNITTQGINQSFIDFKPLINFHTGLYYERELTQKLSARSGAVFTKRGFRISESFSLDIGGINIPVGVSVNTEIKGFTIPIALKYDFMDDSNMKIYGIGGINIARAQSAQIQTTANALFDFNLSTIDIDLSGSAFNRWGTEALIGAGVELNRGNGFYMAELNYNHSLNDFTNDQTTIIDVGVRNKSWSLSIGYGIRF